MIYDKWHYFEYSYKYLNADEDWHKWCVENVGVQGVDWKWIDHQGLCWICIKNGEDATAFKLIFNE